jgi:hypothetical protein
VVAKFGRSTIEAKVTGTTAQPVVVPKLGGCNAAGELTRRSRGTGQEREIFRGLFGRWGSRRRNWPSLPRTTRSGNSITVRASVRPRDQGVRVGVPGRPDRGTLRRLRARPDGPRVSATMRPLVTEARTGIRRRSP